MARSRSASRLAALALACAALGVGCRLFVDLDGLQGGAAPEDAGPEATPPPIDAPADAPPTDAPVDSPVGVDASDAGSDVDAGSACASATALLGSDVVLGKSVDETGSGGVDAVGFTVAGNAVARCAWIYVANVVDASAATTTVAVGVYTNGAGDAPNMRIAQATVGTLVAGWNHAPLDTPVTLTSGEDLWLSYSPSAGAIVTQIDTTCGVRLYQHTDDNDAGGAPPVFTSTAAFTDACNTAVYLGP